MLAVVFAIALAVQQDSTAATRIRADSIARVRAERVQRNAARDDSIAQARRAAGQAAMGDAYGDPAAADLVARARAARSRNERLVTSYSVDVTQRIGVGLRALTRDRMIFGQELAAHIDWQRDGQSRITVSGARQRVPVALNGARVPEDIGDNLEMLVVDPAADYLRLAGDDAEGFVHPMAEGAEADYRFASGDTTTITLSDSRTVRLLELKVQPRRAAFNLMNGSLWFDADSYGLVRAVFAPARPFDIEIDGDSDDADDVPAFVKPLRAEVRFVTLEYALYDSRWWMIRYLAMDAEAQASIMRVPVRFERVYSDYRVQGGAEPVAGARRPAGSVRTEAEERDPIYVARRDSIEQAIDACQEQKADSARAALEAERSRRGVSVEVRVSGGRFQAACRRDIGQPDDRWGIDVEIPADTAALLNSSALGAPFFEIGDVISESELRGLADEIGAIPPPPWQFRPQLPDGVGSILKHVRYNRVEALSLGAEATLDWGRLALDGSARIGVADLEPNGELGLTRPGRSVDWRIGGFRRLAAANPDTRPLGLINSLNAFFAQRDDGQYFRSLGAELTAANNRSRWWTGRVYYEHQTAAAVETQFAMPHLFNDVNVFNPNITADEAYQVGGSLTLHGSKALSQAFNVGAEATVDGGRGTFNFGRGALTGRATVTGLGRFSVGFEAAAGTSRGTLPVQSLFYLGGPATLRGYDGGDMAGEALWRGRGEIALGIPAVRVSLFSDMGWAGARPSFGTGRPLWSTGAGVSVLDGLIRFDLSRAMRAPMGWRFDFYLDGVL